MVDPAQTAPTVPPKEGSPGGFHELGSTSLKVRFLVAGKVSPQ
jgi:hypothetical protein